MHPRCGPLALPTEPPCAPGTPTSSISSGIASYRCGPRCRAVEQLFPAAGLSPKPSWA